MRTKEQDRIRKAAERAADPEGHRAKRRAYYARNKERIRARQLAWFAAHPGYQKQYREKNIEKYRETCERARKKNLHKDAAKSALERAAVLRATPALANKFFIEEIYDLARQRTLATGYEWHVDHIVPLKSKRVCGLHVESNLRVIPAVHNISKGNRHWPNMPEEIVHG